MKVRANNIAEISLTDITVNESKTDKVMETFDNTLQQVRKNAGVSQNGGMP